MKLPVKKEFFDKMKDDAKTVDFRDAHITFICEETGEKLTRSVHAVFIIPRLQLPVEICDRKDLFTDDRQIGFILGEYNEPKN